MALYRREGTPNWFYDFTVNGRRFRGSTGTPSKREAAGVEHDVRQQARQAAPKQSGWRIRDTLGTYWKERAERSKSCDTTFKRLDHLSRILGKDTRVVDLTNVMLLDYRAKRRGEGVIDSTINREIAALKAALRHAEQLHKQPAPILAWGQLRRKEADDRTRYLTRDEHKILMEVAHPSIRPIIVCAVTTGLRKDTILRLDWRMVDLSGAWISVVGKGDKRHMVKITPPLMAALSTLPKRMGRVFDTKNFRKRWDAAVAAADLDNFRFHDLRHTFATWARMAGADIADICEALAHSDISTTMRYAHVLPDEHLTAFDRVSRAFMTQSTTQQVKNA